MCVTDFHFGRHRSDRYGLIIFYRKLQPMVQINNVTYKYSSGEGLDLVNFTIDPGEFVYLTGASGAGKSTILKLIYMELFPQAGHVVVNDHSSLTIKKRHIPYLRRKLGIVFHFASLV